VHRLSPVLTSLLVTLLAQQQPLDASVFRDKLQLFADGKGHYLAVNPAEPYNGETDFWGDGKTFSRIRVNGGGRNGDEAWNFVFWDPRAWTTTGGPASVDMHGKGASYTVTCRRKETPLKPLSPEETKKILSGASFTTYVWWRMPEKLLRDDTGVYYFVDRFRSDDSADRRDFRVFVGKKGALKQMPLKDIVDDAQGMIFATKTGDLRLVTREGKLEGKWIKGSTATELVEVPFDTFESARMIYIDLGPYSGQRLGTPCDDLM
jgi:hypothetical protein